MSVQCSARRVSVTTKVLASWLVLETRLVYRTYFLFSIAACPSESRGFV